MTKLYRLDTDAASVARYFGARSGDDPWEGGYIAPGSFAPIVTAGREFIAGPRTGDPPRRLAPRLWGVPPPPNVPFDGRNGITGVRNIDSPFWIGNLRNSEFRCIVPATSFMEWSDRIDVEGQRIRHWFAAAEAPMLALAGVWKDSEVPSFAIVSARANDMLRSSGRDTMPVLLPDRRAWETWLSKGWDEAKALVQPAPENHLTMQEDI